MAESPANPSSPSKGKGIDTSNKIRRPDWWDFYPLVERPKRPLQWSQSSVIFTAHPNQPSIIGRHFSSSKQFVLSSPTAILASPSSFEPPSLISVSPSDQYLLAYFPKKDGEGIGCLWVRGHEIDSWEIKEDWTSSHGGGIVNVCWLGGRREWIAGASGIPTRLPLRGAPMHVSDPTVLLVTQDNYVQLMYLRQFSDRLKFMKRYLLSYSMIKELQTNAFDIGEHMVSSRQCTEATFGLSYNDSSIFLVTHGQRIPPPRPATASSPIHAFNTMNLSVNIELSNTTPFDQKTIEWENWGEERTLEIFELQVRFDGTSLSLVVNHISTLDLLAPCLAGLTFLCTPPLARSPPSNSSESDPQSKLFHEKGRVMLIANFINFHEFEKAPTSTMAIYGFSPILKPTINNMKMVSWLVQSTPVITRQFEDCVITHIETIADASERNAPYLLYASTLDTSSSPVKEKVGFKGVPVGKLKVLTIPNLADSTVWGSTIIKSTSDVLGRDLPLSTAFSPNKRLFCTLSSSLWQPQIAVYALPVPENQDANARTAACLATAIIGHSSTFDIIHTIAAPTVSISEAMDVLYRTLEILEKYHKNEVPEQLTWDVIGVACEVYRLKARTASKGDNNMLNVRSETALDICSLAACNLAFESCKEVKGYDLEAVWQLIGICTWIIKFTETLMKTCILSSHAVVDDNSMQVQGDPDSLCHPTLLHLAHPFVLKNLFAALNHVKAFRDFLCSLPAGSEGSQIAQFALIDIVDYSGVDLKSLIGLLEECLKSLKEFNSDENRRALAGCIPTPSMRPYLSGLLRKISESQSLLNKSTLFIKPDDLIDGIGNLSLNTVRKSDEKDIITKSPFSKHGLSDMCLRCGGKSMINQDPSSPEKWRLFKATWQRRCICGGTWSVSSMLL